MANNIARLADLVIQSGQSVSNHLESGVFGDADLLTVFGTTVTGSISLEIAFVAAPAAADWRAVGSNDHSDGDLGMKLAPNSSRTLEVAFTALRVKSSVAEGAARTFPVVKRVAV